MNIEAYDADSLRKMVRLLEYENKILKDKLKKAGISYEEVNPFEEKIESAEEYDLQQEDTQGLVFLETETQFYILTYEEESKTVEPAGDFYRWFDSAGRDMQGCRFDSSCNRRKSSMTVQEKVSWYLDLTDTKKLGQSDIASNCYRKSCRVTVDAVVCGMITVSGNYR